jgi:hypothetical protein
MAGPPWRTLKSTQAVGATNKDEPVLVLLGRNRETVFWRCSVGAAGISGRLQALPPRLKPAAPKEAKC